MSDCSSLEEGREGREVSSNRRGNTILTIRQDRKARRVESNNRERRRMHELNHAFQVRMLECLSVFLNILLHTWDITQIKYPHTVLGEASNKQKT